MTTAWRLFTLIAFHSVRIPVIFFGPETKISTGDPGIKEIARGLAQDTKLIRLAMASCSMSAAGFEAIVDALVPSSVRPAVHPRLAFLNIGFMKGTYVFNCIGNYVRDQGAALIATRLLPQLKTLRSMDICHNQITPTGIAAIATALENGSNSGLCGLLHAQYAQTRSYSLDAKIKSLLRANTIHWGKDAMDGKGGEAEWEAKGSQLLRDLETPSYVSDILSVYRTKN